MGTEDDIKDILGKLENESESKEILKEEKKEIPLFSKVTVILGLIISSMILLVSYCNTSNPSINTTIEKQDNSQSKTTNKVVQDNSQTVSNKVVQDNSQTVSNIIGAQDNSQREIHITGDVTTIGEQINNYHSGSSVPKRVPKTKVYSESQPWLIDTLVLSDARFAKSLEPGAISVKLTASEDLVPSSYDSNYFTFSGGHVILKVNDRLCVEYKNVKISKIGPFPLGQKKRYIAERIADQIDTFTMNNYLIIIKDIKECI